MVSPYAFLVVALGLIWFANDPLPTHSRALAGDGVAGLVLAVLTLGAVGVSRLQRDDAPPLLEGPPAFAGLGAREPLLLLGLAGLGALAGGGFESLDWWLAALLWVGISLWYALSGQAGRSFAVPVCAVAVALMTMGVAALEWSPLLVASLVAAAVAVAVHLWMVGRVGFARAERFWRGVSPLLALLALPALLPVLAETAFGLDPYFYLVLPITWLLLWSLGEGTRALFPGRLDPASGSLRLGRGLWFSTRAWVWFLSLQLGGQALQNLEVRSQSAAWIALLVTGALLAPVALGTAAQRAMRVPRNAGDAPEPPLGLTLAPMLAPLVLLACLRIAPLPAAWSEFSHLRGTIALLAPALALPLAGAALVVAASVDHTRGRGARVYARAVGTVGIGLLLAGGLGLEPFVSRWQAEFAAAGLNVGGLAPAVAALMGLAAAATVQRLRQVQRGQPVRAWTLLVLPLVAFAAGSVLVPSQGLVGAPLAASVGVVATLLADRLPVFRSASAARLA